MNKRENVKALIELSATFEEADKIIEEYAGFKTSKEKTAYLQGMYDVEVIDRKEEDDDEYIYTLILYSILRHNSYAVKE